MGVTKAVTESRSGSMYLQSYCPSFSASRKTSASVIGGGGGRGGQESAASVGEDGLLTRPRSETARFTSAKAHVAGDPSAGLLRSSGRAGGKGTGGPSHRPGQADHGRHNVGKKFFWER